MFSKLDFKEEVSEVGQRYVEEIPSGYAIAAYLSAMLGLLTLAFVNLFATASKSFETMVHNIGKIWMPGAAGIGPYSGKETFALAAWLLSWGVLHLAFGKKLRNEIFWLSVFLIGIGCATTLLWPPVTHWFLGHKLLNH